MAAKKSVLKPIQHSLPEVTTRTVTLVWRNTIQFLLVVETLWFLLTVISRFKPPCQLQTHFGLPFGIKFRNLKCLHSQLFFFQNSYRQKNYCWCWLSRDKKILNLSSNAWNLFSWFWLSWLTIGWSAKNTRSERATWRWCKIIYVSAFWSNFFI